MNDQRLATLKEMLKADPDDPFLLYGIAQEHISAEKPAEALPWFERLFTDHPDYVPTYYHFGLALFQTGHAERATAVWKQGVEVAEKAGDRKTVNEIKELLEDLADEYDEEDW